MLIFQFPANRITWSVVLIEIDLFNDKQCRSRSVYFFRRSGSTLFAKTGDVVFSKRRVKIIRDFTWKKRQFNNYFYARVLIIVLINMCPCDIQVPPPPWENVSLMHMRSLIKSFRDCPLTETLETENLSMYTFCFVLHTIAYFVRILMSKSRHTHN